MTTAENPQSVQGLSAHGAPSPHGVHNADSTDSTDNSPARTEILSRIRQALADVPPNEPNTPDAAAVPRDYLQEHGTRTAAQTVDLLAENLADYRAHVHRCTADELPATIAALLKEHGSTSAVIPAELPITWLTAITPDAITLIPDAPDLTPHQLDDVSSVISTCAIAIAETGTIVLDAGPGQGRRMLTLIPDHHICVIQVPDQVVASIPQALTRLTPTRPLTWIAGPSATSDIELDRVEGVHGPRTLDVVLVSSP
jgi:L-lactate dehydrogenase complex protein LldG